MKQGEYSNQIQSFLEELKDSPEVNDNDKCEISRMIGKSYYKQVYYILYY